MITNHSSRPGIIVVRLWQSFREKAGTLVQIQLCIAKGNILTAALQWELVPGIGN